MRKKPIMAFAVISSITSLTVLAPLSAYAEQSPSMAYSAEEWATIRDNNLDFNEIDKLIHEYNPTVLQNAISLKDYLGESSSDISQNYYDTAEQIYANMEYPDEDSSNFASAVTSYLNSQIQYENLMKQGDINTNDEQTYRLQYAQQEANLVKQAQQLMIDYWKSYYNLQTYRNNITTAEANLNSTNLKAVAGTATSSSQLTAEQSVTTAKTTLENAETQLQSTREQLLLMCGWNYGSDAVIGELPEISAETIAAIDVNADIEKALENNYSLKITNRQLENAKTTSVTEQLTTTKSTSEQNIRSNISDLYTNLHSKLTELNAANETLQVRANDKAAADRKLAAGMMTQKDYNAATISYEAAEVSVKQKKLEVLSAYTNYQAAVNGLAST